VIELRPLLGIGEIRPGAELPALLANAMQAPVEGAVLVVTQKVVSKAEGCFVALTQVDPCAEARRLATITGKDPRFVELVLRESTAVVRAARDVLITRHRLGMVMANAGIDCSNLGEAAGDRVLLLPFDPDASARRIADHLEARFARRIAVVISDSFGRPWRNGVVNVAIGAAGLPALLDCRGQPDRDGRPLQITQVAIADLLASAAGLAIGEGNQGIPAVVVSGLSLGKADIPARALVRPVEQDLFQ
jgi:coenzyme F420-0:L-glutamate ligase / coenzyme F420-1:gamma-L-glutamate ligase